MSPIKQIVFLIFLSFLKSVRTTSVGIQSEEKWISGPLMEDQVQDHLTFVDLQVTQEIENMTSLSEYDTSTVQVINMTMINTNVSTVSSQHVVNPCEKQRCVRKCCPSGQFVKFKNCTNLTSGVSEWRPIVAGLEVIRGLPPNPTNHKCAVYEQHEFLLERSGSVWVYDYELEFSPDFYCIDKRQKKNELTTMAYICYTKTLSDFYQKIQQARVVCLCISCFFAWLVLVLLKFIFKIREIQDKCLTCLCSSLFLSYKTLLINKCNEILKNIDYSPCVTLGILQQFYLLSLYVWLTILCYEVMRIVSGTVQAIPLVMLQDSGWTRFSKYLLVAYGIPFLISQVTLTMQLLQDHLPVAFPLPNIAQGRCWIKEDPWSLFIYFHGIQGVLHLLSLFFMVRSLLLLERAGAMPLTVNLPWKKKHAFKLPVKAHNRSNLKLFWNQFFRFLLFIVIWTLDIFTLIYKGNRVWEVVDAVISLQGFFLFLLVLTSGNKWNKLTIALAKVVQSLSPTRDRTSQQVRFPGRQEIRTSKKGLQNVDIYILQDSFK